MRREDNLRQSADAADFRVCLVCWGRNANWGAGPETNLVFHTTPIYDSNSAEFQIILNCVVFVVAMTQWKWTMFFDLAFENSVGAYTFRLTIWKRFHWKSVILERP